MTGLFDLLPIISRIFIRLFWNWNILLVGLMKISSYFHNWFPCMATIKSKNDVVLRKPVFLRSWQLLMLEKKRAYQLRVYSCLLLL